jgi:hypothetical protein
MSALKGIVSEQAADG